MAAPALHPVATFPAAVAPICDAPTEATSTFAGGTDAAAAMF